MDITASSFKLPADAPEARKAISDQPGAPLPGPQGKRKYAWQGIRALRCVDILKRAMKDDFSQAD